MVRIAKVMAKMSWVPKWRALDDSQYQFQLYRVQAQHNLVVIVLRLAVACCNKNLESRNHLQTITDLSSIYGSGNQDQHVVPSVRMNHGIQKVQAGPPSEAISSGD